HEEQQVEDQPAGKVHRIPQADEEAGDGAALRSLVHCVVVLMWNGPRKCGRWASVPAAPSWFIGRRSPAPRPGRGPDLSRSGSAGALSGRSSVRTAGT